MHNYYIPSSAYYQTRYVIDLYVLNIGNLPAEITNLTLEGMPIPYICYPSTKPPIAPGYVFHYQCETNPIPCTISEGYEFNFYPNVTYIRYNSTQTVYDSLTLPTQTVTMANPLQVTRDPDEDRLVVDLTSIARPSVTIYNLGQDAITLKATFNSVPSNVLVRVMTPYGVVSLSEFENELIVVPPEDYYKVVFEMVPVRAGTSKMNITFSDVTGTCFQSQVGWSIVWDITSKGVVGRFLRVTVLPDVSILGLFVVFILSAIILGKFLNA